MSLDTKLPEEMSKNELLRYAKMLEQKVVFLNAEVRKTEANAVITVAALVLQAGGQVVVTQETITRVHTMQFAREARADDSAVVFRVREKPETEPGFTPDGL